MPRGRVQGAQHRPALQQADDRGLSRPVGRVVPPGREADRLGRRARRDGEAGFSVMETGPFGYFPTDPVRLKEEMDARGFRVVAGTGWGILHQAEAWADTEKLFRSIGETHAAVGAEYVVHLPPMFRDEKTGDYTDDRVLSTEAWNLYIRNADRLGPDHEGGLRPEDGPAPPRRQPHRDPRRHRPHLPGDRPRVRRLLPRHRAHRLRRRRPDGAVPQVPRAHLVRPHQGDGPGHRQAGPRRGLAVRQGRPRRVFGDAPGRSARHARPRRGARRPGQGALRGLRAGHVRLRQGLPKPTAIRTREYLASLGLGIL